MDGSEFIKVGNITLGCISPEARDLLDHIMAEWEKHKAERRKVTKSRTTIYGFAYWLVRWSGLVEPNHVNAHAELIAALEKIERWDNFPPSGRFYPHGEEMSYGAAFGSNGERDYMRSVASAALAKVKV